MQISLEFVEALVNGQEPVNPFHVRQIHKLILARIDDDAAGIYRTTQVRIAGAAHTPPEVWLVPPKMEGWV